MDTNRNSQLTIDKICLLLSLILNLMMFGWIMCGKPLKIKIETESPGMGMRVDVDQLKYTPTPLQGMQPTSKTLQTESPPIGMGVDVDHLKLTTTPLSGIIPTVRPEKTSDDLNTEEQTVSGTRYSTIAIIVFIVLLVIGIARLLKYMKG